jgi:hypothetical protein
MNRRNKEIFDAYRLNIDSGELTLEAENPGNITEWITDHDGAIRIALTTDGVSQGLLYRDHQGQPFRTIATTDFRETLQPLFFTFDNKDLYALSNIGRDKAAIVLFDVGVRNRKGSVVPAWRGGSWGIKLFSQKKSADKFIHTPTGSAR